MVLYADGLGEAALLKEAAEGDGGEKCPIQGRAEIHHPASQEQGRSPAGRSRPKRKLPVDSWSGRG